MPRTGSVLSLQHQRQQSKEILINKKISVIILEMGNISDIFSKEKRSGIMSKIRSNETKPEIIIRKYLFSKGFRYRKNDSRYPGKPDIVLPKYKTIIFIHGCFWHGHDCKYGKLPESNRLFWEEKINTNIKRDKKNKAMLIEGGWKVIVVWSCELNNQKKIETRLSALYIEITENIEGIL